MDMSISSLEFNEKNISSLVYESIYSSFNKLILCYDVIYKPLSISPFHKKTSILIDELFWLLKIDEDFSNTNDTLIKLTFTLNVWTDGTSEFNLNGTGRAVLQKLKARNLMIKKF